VGEHPNVIGKQMGLHYGGRVGGNIALVQKPVLRGHNEPLLPEDHHEPAQSLHDVGGVDGLLPGDAIGVEEPLQFKEGEEHLLGVACLHLNLYLASFTPLKPLCGLFLSLMCVE